MCVSLLFRSDLHSQLAEQYGSHVASEAIARSRSTLQLDTMPTMPYVQGRSPSYSHSKYD